MITLQGKKVKLRALEPEDLDFLFEIENNTNFWEVSSTLVPFSRFILKKYLENAHQDIYEAKQVRMVIEEISNNKTIGLIDLFDFNPKEGLEFLNIVKQTIESDGEYPVKISKGVNYHDMQDITEKFK